MRNFFDKSILYELLFVLFAICLIVYFLYPTSFSMSLNAESLYVPYKSYFYTIPDDSVLQVFAGSFHSWYLQSLIYVLVDTYIVFLFKTHPQESIQIVFHIVYILIFLLLTFSLTENFFKYFSVKRKYAVALLLVFTLLFSIFRSPDYTWLGHNDCWFYAYLFLPVFALVLCNDIEKFYILGTKLTKRQIVTTWLMIFFVCVSHEFFRFIFMGALLVGYLADIIVFKRNISVRNLIKDGLIYLSLILLNLITFMTGIYQNYFMGHYHEYSLNEFFQYLREYFSAYKEYLIYDNLIFYIFIVFSLVLIAKSIMNSEQNKRFFIFVSSNLLLLFIFFIVIVLGKEQYDMPMVQHTGLNFLAKLFLLNIAISCCGYFVANVHSLCKKFIFYFVCLSTISFICICFVNNKIHYPRPWEKDVITKTRKLLYVWEKSFFLLNENKKAGDKYLYYDVEGSELPVSENSYIWFYYIKEIEEDELNKKTICMEDDEIEECTNKMIKTLYKDIGYKFTKKELEAVDFGDIYEEYYDK